jgi:hypothetical protein
VQAPSRTTSPAAAARIESGCLRSDTSH